MKYDFFYYIQDLKLITSFGIIIFLFIFYLFFDKRKVKNLPNINGHKQEANNMKIITSELKIKYVFVETECIIKELIKEILDNNVIKIGLDTEYYKGNHYQGHLCLFQISYILNNEKKIFIIDLLKFNRYTIKENFQKVLNNQKIEKIIHASDNDIEWIYEDYGIFVKNVFDTQEIFTYVNESSKRVGLNFLLNHYFKVNLEKQTKKYFQTSDWNQRPLQKEQLNYAALDTYYLIDLREKIFQDLKEKMNHLKKKKKKRLIENADNFVKEYFIDGSSLLQKTEEENIKEQEGCSFILDEFEEKEKSTDYEK